MSSSTTGASSASAASSTTAAASSNAATDAITVAVTNQINVFIFGVIGLIILLRIPHLVGQLQSRCGRPFFQLLGSAPVTSPPKPNLVKQVSQRSGGYDKEWDNSTNGSHDGLEKAGVLRVSKERQDGFVPLHIPSAPSFVSPLINKLRASVIPGFSLMQIAILMNYLYILLYAAFRSSNPFTDRNRSAWIAVSQLPLIFALAQKSSILGSLLGYGYETLNFIHRFAGKLAVLAGNIHAIYYIYKWSETGVVLKNISRTNNAWGLVLLIAMDMMYFFSTSFWRNKAYNVFLWTHTVGIIVIFPAAFLHRPDLQPYVYACIAIYGTDRLVRLAKSRIATAAITSLPLLDMAYIEIPTINAGWRAGQHVRLRVLSSGMGAFGWTESHPFTIASASGSHEGLVLLCKNSGDWTKRLVGLGEGIGDGEKKANGDGQRKVKVWIEGPFGGPSRMVFSSFSAAVLVVGGSGITFGLSMVEELLMKDLKGESKLKYIELVWVVRDPASITPLIPLFSSLIQQNQYTPLKITVHYTRALTERSSVFGRIEATPWAPIAIVYPNLTLVPGRPNFQNVFNNAIDGALSLRSGGTEMAVSGMVVGICGPVGLGEGVVRSVGEIDAATRYRVGGVEVHEETFGW